MEGSCSQHPSRMAHTVHIPLGSYEPNTESAHLTPLWQKTWEGSPLREVHMLQGGPQLLKGLDNVGHPDESCVICVARVSCTSHMLLFHSIRSNLCRQGLSFLLHV